MRSRFSQAVGTGLLILVLVPVVFGQARVVRVDRAIEPGRFAPSDLQMPKFLEGPAAAETYRVHWEPVARPVPKGAVVRFEFRQARAPAPRALEITYPFTITSRRTATFRVADEAYRSGGAVQAWRVRILDRGRVLAESASSGWSGAQ